MWLVCLLPWIDDIIVFYVFLYSIGDDLLEQFPHAVQKADGSVAGRVVLWFVWLWDHLAYMACFHFLGKYPTFRQLSKTLVSSHIARSGRFFKAMYGIVSSPGLVLFLSDFRAFVVSSVVTFLEYSSDGA